MKASILALVAIFLVLGTALHLQEEGGQKIRYPLGFITIQADNGKYLGLCDNCGKKGVNADSAIVASDDANDPNNEWRLMMDDQKNLYIGSSKTHEFLGAFMDRRSRVYYYLFPTAIYSQQTRSKWKLIPLGNDQWALKNLYAGRYLERVGEGFNEPNFGLEVATDPELVFVTGK